MSKKMTYRPFKDQFKLPLFPRLVTGQGGAAYVGPIPHHNSWGPAYQGRLRTDGRSDGWLDRTDGVMDGWTGRTE